MRYESRCTNPRSHVRKASSVRCRLLSSELQVLENPDLPEFLFPPDHFWLRSPDQFDRLTPRDIAEQITFSLVELRAERRAE